MIRFMVFEHKNYNHYLRAVLEKKIQENPALSLRAVARQWKVQASFLSEVLNGKRHLTEAGAMSLVGKLDLDSTETDYFLNLVRLSRSKSPEAKELLLTKLKEIHPQGGSRHDLGVDHFITISEWQHFALLTLLDMPNIEANVDLITRALGISKLTTETTLERLTRLELIECDEKGNYHKIGQNYLVQSATHHSALKKYHTQMIEKTVQALDTQSPQQRFTGTEDIILSENDLPKAAAIFEECFQKILALSEKSKKHADEIYHVGIHCIRIAQVNPKTKNPKTPRKEK